MMGQQPEDMFDSPLHALPPDEQRRAYLEQAERCRRLATAVYSREIILALESMASRFDKAAAELARKQR